MNGEAVRYSLTEIHIEAAKAALDKFGPCTLLNLVKHLKSQSICNDLDNINFVCQLRQLSDAGLLDKSKILKQKPLRGLTSSQKEAIVGITSEAEKTGKTLTFRELAEQILQISNDQDEDIDSIEQKIRFLFIPLYSGGCDDDEEFTS